MRRGSQGLEVGRNKNSGCKIGDQEAGVSLGVCYVKRLVRLRNRDEKRRNQVVVRGGRGSGRLE